MNLLKYTAICIIGMVIGFSFAIIAIKNQAFVNVLKMVNWKGLTFWISLFLSATIPIIANYVFIKKQEVIKLKAKLAQDKIDIVREYKAYDLFMRMTVILDKNISDLSFCYEPTNQDLSAPSLRGLSILGSHETYSDWKLKNMLFTEKLNGLGSKDISNYIWYMLHYILNLDILIEDIHDDKIWEVSVAVKNDFINMSSEFGVIIDKYLNHTLYKFKNHLFSKKQDYSQDEIAKKLNNTNLIKYKSELLKLKEIQRGGY